MLPESLSGRILAVTYCSRRKREDAGLLPAVERYSSPRIPAARDWARRHGADFRILSGRYGLLDPAEPIPYYDHLLGTDEVEAMTERVAGQLEGWDGICFLEAAGDYVAPYIAVMTGAARRRGLPIAEVTLDGPA